MKDDTLLFNYARRKKRQWGREPMAGLTAAEFDELKAVIREYEAQPASPDAPVSPTEPPKASRALRDPSAFYGALRGSFGSLSQGQVDGFNRLLGAMGTDGWPVSWAAYGLATAWWETNRQMHPVEEGYYLGTERAQRHQRSLRYYPWYGRGDVQLTWEKNYRAADAALGLDGALIADPNKAMDPAISARVLVWGMRTGAFTTKKLGDYLKGEVGDVAGFKQARKIINGTDKDDEIAAIAMKMQAALQAGGWA